MSEHLISIILPTYNRVNILERCINSVLAQSYSNWELIISDDGSTDDTPTIAKKCTEKDSRIHYYRNSVRQGLPRNRNIAVSVSKGDFIFFIEDDLTLEPDCLKILLSTFKELETENNKIGAIAPRLIQKHEEIKGPLNYDTYLKLKKSHKVCTINKKTGLIYDDFGLTSTKVEECPTLHACSLIPKTVFKNVGGYEEKKYKGVHFREETDFYFRVKDKGYKLYFQPNAITHHEHVDFGGCRASSSLIVCYYIVRNHIIFLHRIFGIKSLYMIPLFLLDSAYKTLKYFFVVVVLRKIIHHNALQKLS